MGAMSEILASDRERDRVADHLKRHFAEGRLTAEELSERLERAFSARTRGDLSRLTRDLPGRPVRGRRRSADLQRAMAVAFRLAVIAAVVAFVVAAAAAIAAGWLVWLLVAAALRGGCAHRRLPQGRRAARPRYLSY